MGKGVGERGRERGEGFITRKENEVATGTTTTTTTTMPKMVVNVD